MGSFQQSYGLAAIAAAMISARLCKVASLSPNDAERAQLPLRYDLFQNETRFVLLFS